MMEPEIPPVEGEIPACRKPSGSPRVGYQLFSVLLHETGQRAVHDSDDERTAITVTMVCPGASEQQRTEKRRKPYVPFFSKTLARITDPAVGASRAHPQPATGEGTPAALTDREAPAMRRYSHPEGSPLFLALPTSGSRRWRSPGRSG